MQTDNNSTHTHEHAPPKPKTNIQIFILLGGSVLVSFVMVVISMFLYNQSGASQLDLSLPGLQEERIRAQQTKRYDDFGSTGRLDEKSLSQFDKLYKEQQQDIKRAGAGFDNTPLGDDKLGISVQ